MLASAHDEIILGVEIVDEQRRILTGEQTFRKIRLIKIDEEEI